MRKYIIKILTITCIACFFLYYGCSEQEEKQHETIVVSKKIVSPLIVSPLKEKRSIKNDQKFEISKPETINENSKTDKTNTSPNQKLDQKPDQKIELSEPTVTYKAEGKIDPFASILRDSPSVFVDQNDKKKKKLVPLTPIEKVDLSQLKLVVIIFAPSGNKALVEEASGKGFVIKKGTRIGIHSGKVMKILKSRVIVQEKAETILGKTILVEKELKLQKPSGEE